MTVTARDLLAVLADLTPAQRAAILADQRIQEATASAADAYDGSPPWSTNAPPPPPPATDPAENAQLAAIVSRVASGPPGVTVNRGRSAPEQPHTGTIWSDHPADGHPVRPPMPPADPNPRTLAVDRPLLPPGSMYADRVASGPADAARMAVLVRDRHSQTGFAPATLPAPPAKSRDAATFPATGAELTEPPAPPRPPGAPVAPPLPPRDAPDPVLMRRVMSAIDKAGGTAAVTNLRWVVGVSSAKEAHTICEALAEKGRVRIHRAGGAPRGKLLVTALGVR